MFYSEFVLAKKGPLGKVWLAAHWNKKLTRAMIAKSDVVEACDSIIKPAAPLALRTSGHLLLGVVRIHDSKQKNLMTDCSEALIKIKLAFRPGLVDLPISSMQASYSAITMQESFQDLDIDQPLFLEGGEEMLIPSNTGRVHEITLKESRARADDTAPGMEEAVPFFEQGRDEPMEVGRDADATIDRTLGLDRTADGMPPTDTGISFEHRDDDGYQPDIPPPDLAPMSPMEISALATPSAKAKKSKRKLAADEDTELTAAYIRQRLEETGADDVTRTSAAEATAELAFDRPVGAHLSAVDQSLEAAFLVPNTSGWAPALRNIISRNFSNQLALAKARRRSQKPATPEREPEPERHYDTGYEPDLPPAGDQVDQSFGGPDATAFSGDISAAFAPSQPAAAAAAEVTSQEYEFAGRSRRTQRMTENLHTAFSKQDELYFSAMTQGQSRRVAAACLFELLVLATDGAIKVVQEEPYEDISITATSLFPSTAA